MHVMFRSLTKHSLKIPTHAGSHQLRVYPRGEQIARHVLDYRVLDSRTGNERS